MAFCGKCGIQVQDGIKFCPSCGKEVGAAPAGQAQPIQQQALANDAETNKVMAILSYILFFIPIITGDYKKSPFVKYHVNQGTILFGIEVAYGIISGILSAIIRTPIKVYGYSTGVYHTPGWLTTILWILSLGIFALCIYGIYNAATGKTKPLPVIGDKFTIFK